MWSRTLSDRNSRLAQLMSWIFSVAVSLDSLWQSKPPLGGVEAICIIRACGQMVLYQSGSISSEPLLRKSSKCFQVNLQFMCFELPPSTRYFVNKSSQHEQHPLAHVCSSIIKCPLVKSNCSSFNGRMS